MVTCGNFRRGRHSGHLRRCRHRASSVAVVLIDDDIEHAEKLALVT